MSVVRGFSDTQQVSGVSGSFDFVWVALLLYFLSFINVLVVDLLLPALLGMIPVV